jgi:hypothetical protein
MIVEDICALGRTGKRCDQSPLAESAKGLLRNNYFSLVSDAGRIS